MKKTILLLASVVALIVTAMAQPAFMNYQGRLLDPAGQPLTNGSYRLEFNIYTSATGTNLVWGPFLCDDGGGNGHALRAVVANGRFNVILGANDTASRPLTGAFLDADRFVEIKVDDGTAILPRQQILSAPYALQSQSSQIAQFAQLSQMAVQASNLVQQAAETLCPPGTIVAYGGHTNAIPSGWLLCDGTTVSRTTYVRLFLAVGTAWGSGNGVNTFHIPDLRGMFLRGANLGRTGSFQDLDRTNRAASASGGNTNNAVGSVQTNELKSHRHQWRGYWNHGGDGEIAQAATLQPNDPLSDTTLDTGGNETRPNNAYVNYIIKY